MADTSTSVASFLQNGQLPTGSAIEASTQESTAPQYWLDAGKQALANQAALMTQPYQPYQGPRVADFTQDQRQGFGMTGRAAGAYQPGLTAGVNTTNAAAAAPGALMAAQPWLNAAGQSSVSNIGAYMNPYMDSVIGRIGELGARNLSENLMPAITSKFINAGQLGFGPHTGMGAAPSGMTTDALRALRDTNADVLAQQTAAMQQGYTQAANLAGTDLSRYSQLASTAGGLANQQQQTQLQAGQQQADLGGMAQKYGLAGAQAVQDVGAQQQKLNQQNLDTRYADFLRQQGWPQQQIDAMVKTMGGIQSSGAIPTALTKNGIVPTGQPAQYAPSDLATAGGIISGIGSIIKALP